MKCFGLGVLTTIILMGSSAFAGVGSSGGGPSVYCPQASDPEGIAQLYDFFEGRLRRGFNIAVTNSLTKEAQADLALKKLYEIDPDIGLAVRAEYNDLQGKINYLPAGVSLGTATDLGSGEPPLSLANCQILYVGYFEVTGQVSVAKEIYDHFTETEKAALLVHEALYSIARERTQQTDSRSARIINGYLFSQSQTASDVVNDALATLRNKGGAPVTPIQISNDVREVVLKTSCPAAVDDQDFISFHANIDFWKSGTGGLLPFSDSAHLYSNENSRASEQVIKFTRSTRVIQFNNPYSGNPLGDAPMVSRSGRCANEAVELFYNGVKVQDVSPTWNFIWLVNLYE